MFILYIPVTRRKKILSYFSRTFWRTFFFPLLNPISHCAQVCPTASSWLISDFGPSWWFSCRVTCANATHEMQTLNQKVTADETNITEEWGDTYTKVPWDLSLLLCFIMFKHHSVLHNKLLSPSVACRMLCHHQYLHLYLHTDIPGTLHAWSPWLWICMCHCKMFQHKQKTNHGANPVS